uniref:Putative Polysaccharide biosynthesis protein n=1 Tax=Magnetococcus massalia (strain MO-1) TaxID=451514 RepID=A0A1S7LFE1_MAGMO|nr:putative Polysaccharide biosynthesis protein [Candidatus Magnetococcus massalia]
MNPLLRRALGPLLPQTNAKTLDRDVGSGVIWNAAAMVLIAILGVLLNILIGHLRGPEALGIFNQVMALFLIGNQIAAGGLHFSVLRHMSDRQSYPPAEQGGMVLGALLVGSLWGALICAMMALLAPTFGNLLESPAVAQGTLVMLPGLWAYVLNKTMLGALNGQRRMRFYAVALACRFLLLTGGVALLIGLDTESAHLPMAFSMAEGGLLLLLLGDLLWRQWRAGFAHWARWAIKHIRFGPRAASIGLLVEVNTRVDVLMLGFFMDDATVGIYSFAAMLAEGLTLFVVVVRQNIAPLIPAYETKGLAALRQELMQPVMSRMVPAMLLLNGIGIAFYPLFSHLLMEGRGFEAGWLPFVILGSGVALSSGHNTFLLLLNQLGHPGKNSVLVALLLLTNGLLNLILIPLFGLNGAALATALSLICLIPYQNLFLRQLFSPESSPAP